MSPPGIDPLNEQLGMEAVQKETPPKINKEHMLCKCQVNNKYGQVQARVTVHATEASKQGQVKGK
jgi:hypothetical protein